MTDVRTLLRDNALRPDGALDMAGVYARANRHSIRRLAAWLAGLGAVIGVAVPVGDRLLVNAGDDRSVGIVDPRPPTEQTTPTVVAPGQAPRGELSGLPHASTGTPPTAARDLQPTRPAPSPTDPPTTLPEQSYPSGASCSVDTLGLEYSGERSCRFTATTAGGWSWYKPSPNATPAPYNPPRGTVYVTHNGEIRRYETEAIHTGAPGDPGPTTRIEGCADNIIQPGDLVEVVIRNMAPTTLSRSYSLDDRYEMGVGAGRGWSCSNPGP